MTSSEKPDAADATSDGTLRVGFPLYNGCTLLDFAGATQVFAFTPGFQAVWLAPTRDPIATTESVKVLPGATFGDAGKIDILFVPGGGPAVAKVMLDPVYVDFIREVGGRARLAGSVCTGAFLLAAAGLLDDVEATTYWCQRENLALFPRVRVAAGFPRWVLHGNRFTGGGVSSSIDLALELVNQLSGPTQSMSSQLAVQYAPSPPYESGDPAQAPPEVTATLDEQNQGFIASIRKATLEVIGGGS
ncbi:MAG TPA: DJ-1/PfpI family protein [Thermoanaerobaculia bacterium]|nr:DJ-1/PfpI family protein [Thermoanaerobaculia bacterium]